VRLTHVFETHIHNDYLTGGLALAQRTGGTYLANAEDQVGLDRTPVRGGQTVQVGRMRVTAVSTPGHTFTHLSYALAGESSENIGVFSGGSLLFGSTGRPDVVGAEHTGTLARKQYASAHTLAGMLPDTAGDRRRLRSCKIDLPGQGHLSGLLNFQPQGFVDARGPLFCGTMLSGVAMDYTLFLLSAAREHYDATGDPHFAMREALGTSGRVVVAAAGVMVAVFSTFALSGPLAPKEMGIILAVAVFLDALCIRLIVLPVVLRLTGHKAWYAPRWLNRLLPVVRFSH
jgi:hypothetical protein